jgi:hypothetical protein
LSILLETYHNAYDIGKMLLHLMANILGNTLRDSLMIYIYTVDKSSY